MDGEVQVKRYRYAPRKLELLSENGGIANSIKSQPALVALVPLLLLFQIFAIAHLLRKQSVDIVHAHWIFPQGFCAALAKYLSFSKTPILCTSHGGDLYGLKSGFFHKIKNWTLKRFDHFAVVSHGMKQYVSDFFHPAPENIHVLPMGVDLQTKFIGDPSSHRTPGSLLFVGRLVKKKGVNYLIQSIKLLHQREMAIQLTIVGEGPERPALETLSNTLKLNHSITFRGGLESQQLPELYRSAPLAIFPFVQAEDGDMEGLGLVMVEAMGCGCLVIAGDVPAVHDVIEDGVTGYICNPTDPVDLADQIEKVLTQDSVRKKVAANGMLFVQQHFSWDHCANQYHLVFSKMG